LAGALSGCFSFGGGDKTVQQKKNATTGQELQDLEAAYDKGIISEREYNQQGQGRKSDECQRSGKFNRSKQISQRLISKTPL
jgi:hypothetical protein